VTDEPFAPRAVDEVVDLVSTLIRFDTSNTGELETTRGEEECAKWVAQMLEEVGYTTQYVESGQPGRGNVFARLPGPPDSDRGALLIHGHLDVVPAEPADWSVHPFSGTVKDGYIWGRGAVDMKDMVGMALALARQFQRDGTVPPRELVFAFLADEEAGGSWGAHWLVEHRPDLFEGITEAVGEVGGYSLTVDRPDGSEKRLYLVETAEKGLAWMKLTADATAGHGSFLHADNAVTEVAEAVARIGRHTFPLVISDSVAEFLAAVSEESGLDLSPDAADLETSLFKLGSLARIIGATLRDTANPTMLRAGYKATHLDSYETTFDGDLVDAMNAAILAHDPQARTVPYMMSGGTDAKAFAKLGIRCFGFAPLQLPRELDFAALFHGVDERVPVDSVLFGTRVLEHFLLNS
jgi:acetylornithine deacetylase/succinyl-diaminopimelate desuccinylase-like protein